MEHTGRIIGYDNSLFIDVFMQGISIANLVLWIVTIILLIRLILLGIKALKIYINKNS